MFCQRGGTYRVSATSKSAAEMHEMAAPAGPGAAISRNSRAWIYVLRGGDGGAPDVRDATTGATGTGTTGRATGDGTAGATRAGRPCRAAGDRAGRALGAGATTGSTRDHTAGTTGTGFTAWSTGDSHIGATGTGGADAGARGAIGIPARRRGGLCAGNRCESDGRASGTREQKGRHLRQFHHHEKQLPPG